MRELLKVTSFRQPLLQSKYPLKKLQILYSIHLLTSAFTKPAFNRGPLSGGPR